MDGDESLDWWPPHVQAIFAAIGQAMGEKRLHPDTLTMIPSGVESVLPGHQVTVEHVSAKDLGRRKTGQYRIRVEGPALAGGWRFYPGKLERLSRLAVNRIRTVHSPN
jgi:hypothetical protein